MCLYHYIVRSIVQCVCMSICIWCFQKKKFPIHIIHGFTITCYIRSKIVHQENMPKGHVPLCRRLIIGRSRDEEREAA
jgi:hypothetical protein